MVDGSITYAFCGDELHGIPLPRRQQWEEQAAIQGRRYMARYKLGVTALVLSPCDGRDDADLVTRLGSRIEAV